MKWLQSLQLSKLKYDFFPGTVLFVRKMGECLVFITILFVTQSAIVVAEVMSDLTGFAKVSHSESIESFFLFWFHLFFIICWTNWAQMEISFICMSLSYGNLAQKRFLELPIFLICAYPAYVNYNSMGHLNSITITWDDTSFETRNKNLRRSIWLQIQPSSMDSSKWYS